MAVSQPPVASAPSPRTGLLSAERLERFAPLTGIAAVALIAAGGIVVDGSDQPADEAPAQAYLTYFDQEQDALFLGSFLVMLGCVFLLWFAASGRARLAVAEGGAHRLASLAFAGATAMVVLLLAAVAPSLSAAFAIDEDVALTPEAAQALYAAGSGLFYAAWFGGAVFLLATGLAMLRTRVMPRWLGPATLAMGVLLLIPWVSWAVFLFLLPVWTVLTALLLFREHPRATP